MQYVFSCRMPSAAGGPAKQQDSSFQPNLAKAMCASMW